VALLLASPLWPQDGPPKQDTEPVNGLTEANALLDLNPVDGVASEIAPEAVPEFG
jgi:hypothetical protein